jgi:pilus assembly protein CpaC
MRWLPLVGLVGSITALTASATGEAADRKEPPPPAGAVNVRPTGTIVLEVGKGTLIKLPHPAATVFVANPDIADVQVKSPALVYVSAKAAGDTVIYAVDANDNVLLSDAIRVEFDVSALRQSFAQLLPGDRITARTVEGKLVLSGIVATAGEAQRARALAAAVVGEAEPGPTSTGSSTGGTAGGASSSSSGTQTGSASSSGGATGGASGGASAMGTHIVNQIVVATPNQVNLRVRIAEVQRNVLKQLGINWSKCATLGAGAFPGTPTLNCSGAQPPLAFQMMNPITGGPADIVGTNIQNAVTIGRSGAGGQAVSATLDALGQEGLATILAEPNLTAVSGQTASFLVGGIIQIPTSISNTGTVPTISVSPEPFGVRRDFTPTIIDARHISQKLRPEISQLNFANSVTISGFSIPGKDETVAETTVELGSGESFALAGLLRHTSTQDISKIPGLGDLPILGALFRSLQFQRNETELVIIITPYLVQPVATALATPVDGFTSPHDSQAILNGETYRQKLPGPARGPLDSGGGGLIGPAGFRLN